MTDRATYRPGSQVSLIAASEKIPAIRTPAWTRCYGVVEAPDSPPIPITLTPRKNEPAAFEANFTVEHPGPALYQGLGGRSVTRTVARFARPR